MAFLIGLGIKTDLERVRLCDACVIIKVDCHRIQRKSDWRRIGERFSNSVTDDVNVNTAEEINIRNFHRAICRDLSVKLEHGAYRLKRGVGESAIQ